MDSSCPGIAATRSQSLMITESVLPLKYPATQPPIVPPTIPTMEPANPMAREYLPP